MKAGHIVRRATALTFALSTTLAFAACNPTPDRPPDDDSKEEIPFTTHGTLQILREGLPVVTIDIEIADNDSSRMRGMMQRSGFPEMSGMLFIFPFERLQSFWMANTPLSLDMLFADADSHVVDIHRYTRPLSPESVDSSVPSQFVLELPAGFCDTHGIVESDRLRWSRLAEAP